MTPRTPSRLKRVLLTAGMLIGVAACSTGGEESLLDQRLVTLSGEPSTLAGVVAEAGGAPVVVNFWASYCKPCIREMPVLDSMSRELEDVRFVGINALDERERALEMIEQTGVSYPVWLDERGDAMSAAGVRSLPATFVLVDGKISYRKLGEIRGEELRAAIEDVRRP